MRTNTHSGGSWLLAMRDYALLFGLILTICPSVFGYDPNWWHYQNDWHNSGPVELPATNVNGTDWHDPNAWGSQNNGYGTSCRPPDSNVYAAIEPKPPGPEITGDAKCSRLSIHPWSWDGAPNIEVNILPTAGTISCGVCIGIGDMLAYDSATQGHGTLNVYGGTMTTPTAPSMPGDDVNGLWIGGGVFKTGNCYGIVNMYGGQITVPRIAVYYGVVNLYGGLLYHTGTNAADFVIFKSHAMNKINVCDDGELRLQGDRVQQVNYYIQQGRICPCGEQNVLAVGYQIPPEADYTLVKGGRPFYVDRSATGANNGSSWEDAFNHIQDALVATEPPYVIFVAQGTYHPDEDTNHPSGTNDRTATFQLKNGVALYGGFPSGGGVWSSRNPNIHQTTLSGNLDVNVNSYHVVTGSGTNSSAVLDGFTITEGQAISPPWDAEGGGIYNIGGSPTISNCTFSDNWAYSGGGIYDFNSNPTITNCAFTGGNSAGRGGGIYNESSNPILTGCTFSGSALWGTGSAMFTQSGCSPRVNNCTFGGTLTIQGSGDINIVYGGEVIIESNAVIDLNDPLFDPNARGSIHCNGLLKVKDNGQFKHATVNISRQTGGVYGKLQVEDSAQAKNLDIYTDGDRFMDVDPCTFTGLIQNNRIYVTITEGQNGSDEGVLEVRGRDFAEPPCGPNQVCQISSGAMPPFDTNSWTLERLELLPGAKLNLVGRFSSGNGSREVLYVKDLNFGDGCVLNVGSEHIYFTDYTGDLNSIEKISILGISLGKVDCDSDEEFQSRVNSNNYTDPADPNNNRIYIERVTDLETDPNGIMKMRNLADPCTEQVISARAKMEFAPCIEDEIRVRFDYLFDTTDPNVQIVAYLSDVPEIMEPNDPNRALHYIEVGRVSAPPVPLPGSAGSNRFGNFEALVSTGELDLSQGTWIELVLIEPATGGYGGGHYSTGPRRLGDTATTYCNNIGADTPCKSECGKCLDLDDDCDILPSDFLAVVSGAGGDNTPICVDGGLSNDGYTDSYDTASWDWTMDDTSRLDLCGRVVPLRPATAYTFSEFPAFGGAGKPLNLDLNDLLVCGKRGPNDSWTKLNDRLYVFDSNYQYKRYITAAERCNIRIVRGEGNALYQINSENGVWKLDPNVPIVPRNKTTCPNCPNEPRYNKPAKIYVGVQGSGVNSYGRPILDAAFDANYVYVVPVVVEPNGNEPNTYAVAAKLQLDPPGSNPPYHVVKLYDEPNLLPGDNQLQYRNSLREIELDSAGNVYVTNSHVLNACNILWKFEPNGTVRRLNLDINTPHVRAPTGLCVSSDTNMLYLTSSQCGLQPDSVVIYGFSTATLTPVRTITVFGMQHITSITEDPVTKSLWVAGFSFNCIPDRDKIKQFFQDAPPFYDPYLAKVPPEPNDVNVSAVCVLRVGGSDLAMPLSICWTGARPTQEKCGGADLNGNGTVNMLDFATLARHWLNTNCNEPDNPCEGADLEPEAIPDGDVDLRDLDVFTVHWLNTGCL